MIKFLGILIIAIFFTGCTSKEEAERVLQNEGYTNIKITGYDFLACSTDDIFHTGFIAMNREGKVIEGTVCSGWFKGSTIRYH